MPWTPKSFASKHNKKLAGTPAAGAAARQASAMVRSGVDEGIAIATANKRANRLLRRRADGGTVEPPDNTGVGTVVYDTFGKSEKRPYRDEKIPRVGPFPRFDKYPQAKARGGPAKEGGPYLVGEKGPELFVPKQKGNIVSNRALANRLLRSGRISSAKRDKHMGWSKGETETTPIDASSR